MSSVSSPARFSGDFDGFYDANFTADISNKMRVPHRIRVVGNGDEGESQYSNRNLENDKIEMYVPGRILVAGQDQHIGLKSPPRELHLEQSMLPPPSTIRVQTPPRVLTLEDHPFPTVDEDQDTHVTTNHATTSEANHTSQNPSTLGIEHSMTLSYPSCPSTPPLNQTSEAVISPSEETNLLRRHVAKLGRRVLVLENDSQQRQQREVIVYTLGVAYFLLKTILWFNRHW